MMGFSSFDLGDLNETKRDDSSFCENRVFQAVILQIFALTRSATIQHSSEYNGS